MKNFLGKIKNAYNEVKHHLSLEDHTPKEMAYQEYLMDCDGFFDEEDKRKAYSEWVFFNILTHYYGFRFIIIIITCEIFGHNIIEDGYVGPEGGHTYLVCKRCGKNLGGDIYC